MKGERERETFLFLFRGIEEIRREAIEAEQIAEKDT